MLVVVVQQLSHLLWP